MGETVRVTTRWTSLGRHKHRTGNVMSDPSAARVPFEAKAEPVLKTREVEAFYAEALQALIASGIPFLVAGTHALSAYTGLSRRTKDLDIFCKAGDHLRLLAHCKELGYAVEMRDERWLGKVFKGQDFFDVIFASVNGTMPVSDSWFQAARQITLFDAPVQIVGPTELIWSKSFIQMRHRHDGADVAHLILRVHDEIDWKGLLAYMDIHWEVLLTHLLNFRWIYPADREKIPAWLIDELLDRLARQRELPPARKKLCRGRMFSRSDYEVDINEWGFADICADNELDSE